MTITGQVKDKKTGAILPQASVFASDANGKPIGAGVLADKDGKFSIDSKSFDDPTTYLGVSYTGYADSIILPGSAGPYIITLEPTGELEAVYVTAKRKVKQAPKWVWWAAGGAAAIGIGIWIWKAKFSK